MISLKQSESNTNQNFILLYENRLLGSLIFSLTCKIYEYIFTYSQKCFFIVSSELQLKKRITLYNKNTNDFF